MRQHRLQRIFLYLKFRFTLASAVFQINTLFGVGIAQVRQFERLRFAHHGDDVVAIGAFQQTVAGKVRPRCRNEVSLFVKRRRPVQSPRCCAFSPRQTRFRPIVLPRYQVQGVTYAPVMRQQRVALLCQIKQGLIFALRAQFVVRSHQRLRLKKSFMSWAHSASRTPCTTSVLGCRAWGAKAA